MLKLLTTGWLSAEFSQRITTFEPSITVRHLDSPSQQDVDWADCLASFYISKKVSLQSVPWIHCFGAGVDGFLSRDDLGQNLILSRTTGKMGEKAGEFCLCHILGFLHKSFANFENNKKRQWVRCEPVSVRNKEVLILGTGTIAQGVASALYSLGVKVTGANTTGLSPIKEFHDCLKMDLLPKASKNTCCIINTLPLNSNTKGLIDRQLLALFDEVLVINVGRGQSLVTQDLVWAIENSHVAYAVLDVFEKEPLPESSPLWQHPKILVTPHHAAVTTVDDIIECFAQAYRQYDTKRDSTRFVDLDKEY